MTMGEWGIITASIDTAPRASRFAVRHADHPGRDPIIVTVAPGPAGDDAYVMGDAVGADPAGYADFDTAGKAAHGRDDV